MEDRDATAAPAAGAPLSFVGFGGVRLAAEAWGDRNQPAVLILPGGGQSKSAYRQSARALAAAGRYVVCLDLRGHGDSDWPTDGRYDLDAMSQDVIAVLREIGARPVVLAASLGGMAALAALGESEVELASGLVLVDAAPWIDADEARRVRALVRKQACGFADVREAAHAARQLSPRRQVAGASEGLLDQLRESADGRLHWKWDPASICGIDGAACAERLEAAATKIKAPVLLVRGGESSMVSHESISRLRAMMPAAEVAEIPGAGHLVVSDQADAFDASILDFLERRALRQPLQYTAGSDARTLRDALGCFGTGVTIVTTMTDDGPVGLTANSFTSVSLDPPLILFCLSVRSGSLAAFRAAKRFAINVLHIGQHPASAAFTGPAEKRFEAVPWTPGELGLPVLTGSLATFECEFFSTQDAGDHVVFIGEVKAAVFEPHRDPLLYFRGRYRRLHFQ